MASLWFVMPAHGREDVARVCMAQLARTIDTLQEHGIDAAAVVVAEDGNLDTARDLGFGTIDQTNDLLGRRFNDGYQFATDPAFNPRPADYVIPIGSDDWIDPNLLLQGLPDPDTIMCFRDAAIVRENGRTLAHVRVTYEAGLGIRIIPRQLIANAGHRPAEDWKTRAVDTSTLHGLKRANPSMRIAYRDMHPNQIVDWKTSGLQLNSYRACLPYAKGETSDPFLELADTYPADALDGMRSVYQLSSEVTMWLQEV